ncbi:DUF4080 domain-containing protein [Clostridium sp.]|uniref:B12-binding domain-containing radical SAM protein n=1 Tax=Clostridium sp. TaxID=1506 RepID=UPI002FC801C4
MKVVLVGINSKFVHSNLPIRYLKAFTKDLDYLCHLMEFSINDRPERVVDDIIAEKPSILGFSCYIWNIEFIKRVSTLIKLIDPDIEILYGGPESSFDAPEFLKNNLGEYVIEGEGEETYREFIQGKIKETVHNEDVSYGLIKGLYSKDENHIIYGGKRPLMNMNDIVFPYTDDDDLNNKIVYYEASRGCPFNCKYCLSSTTNGVRFLNPTRVKEEISFLVKKGVNLVKFVDRTFNCNRDFANDIWSYLVEQGGDSSFHFEISADLLTREAFDILSKAKPNSIQFEIGVQSTNKEVLKSINRVIGFSDIKKNVEELNRIKTVKQHLDLIAGLPGENFESFKRSFNEVYEINPDELQLGFLKIIKGTTMKEEAALWGMICSPYPPYEIIKTKDISYDELTILRKIEHMVDKYLNSGKFNNILEYFLTKDCFETPFDFYLQLSKLYEEKGYFKRNISFVDYYEIFIEFAEKNNFDDLLLLKDIIKFDYLRFNKKKGLPLFLHNEIDKKEERMIKEEMLGKNLIGNTSDITIHKFNFKIKELICEGMIREENNYIGFFNKEDKYIFV